MYENVLAQNQYGKAENRIVKITRKGNDGSWHEIRDLNVSVALRGEFDAVHFTGDNANCLPTDTTKNTVYAFAKEHGVESPEAFGLLLAKHFVESQGVIHEARIRLEEYAWERIVTTDKQRHSFARRGQEVRTAEVLYSGATGRFQVVSGLKDLTVLNSTASEFHGYIKDDYTTLKEAYDRILATKVTARWAHAFTGAEGEKAVDWDRSYRESRRHLLEAFAETYSYSLQQTLYAMANRVLDHRPEVNEVRLNLPNKHHFLADLEPFGLKNDNEVYFAADRMYGLIEGTVHRPGLSPVIPVNDWITA
ncbi:factor-independent urate hydroxylase [Kitasatospora sp. NPDC054939]